VLSYPNLYLWNVQSFDSGTLAIAANSSNEGSFYAGIGPDLKKVEAIVEAGPWHYNSMFGECVWITKPFQMSLLGGLGNTGSSVGYTTGVSPPVDYTFDVPSSWNVLGGIRISNPENQPVSVNFEIIFHNQTVNFFWETALIIGLTIAVIGIILMLVSIKKGRISVPPPHAALTKRTPERAANC